MDYVGIPTSESAWRFETFTKDQYNAILTKIKNGDVTISGSVTDAPTTSKLKITWHTPFASSED